MHSIKITHPDIYANLICEWDTNKNINLLDSYSYGSRFHMNWICKNCQSPFQATIAKRCRGHNCPFCSGRQINNTNCLATTHPHLLEWWDTNKNIITPTEITRASNKKIFWKCPINPAHTFYDSVKKITSRKHICNMCNRSSIKFGFRKGKILVIDEIIDDIYNKNSKYIPHTNVKVKCDCGNIFITTIKYISSTINPSCKDCQYQGTRKYKIGDIFGDLEIISFNKEKAICKCICNNIIEMQRAALKNRHNLHCGCKKLTLWKGTDIVSGTYFSRIKRNAQKRNIEFNITIQDITELYKKQNGKCALTNLPLILAQKQKDIATASLDRIDSTKGYIISNIQWVHKEINVMKMNKIEDRFIELCKLVAEMAITKLLNIETSSTPTF